VEDLAQLVESLPRPRIAVVGDVMLDRHVAGECVRVSQEAPVPVLDLAPEASEALGGAANAAAKAAALGAEPRLVGLVGADPEARCVRAFLDAAGLDAGDLVEDAARSTTVKTRYLARGQQVLRADRESRTPASGETLSRLAGAAREAVVDSDAVLLSDYAKGALAPAVLATVMEAAREKKIPVVVDPAGRDYGRYRGATLATPNVRELELAANVPVADAGGLEAAAEKVLAGSGVSMLAVTRGAEGLSLFRRGASGAHFPARCVEVFDVTGAGDAVAAVFALALGGNLAVEDAARLANLAGECIVGQAGVGELSRERLAGQIALHACAAGKIAARERATELARAHRMAGRSVVFTNGCFDLLHAGHIKVLEEARALGDVLVVGLNTDASVRRLKGEGRPVLGEAERAQILGALGVVDLVVLFDEDTPVELIRALRPDVLVKGADYAESEVVGGDLVTGWGGRVALVPLLEGRSTSALIDRLRGAS